MKRISGFLLVVMAVLAFFSVSVPVRAETAPMTEAHIAQIRANCVDAQSVLAQLHASDALLRVNRGQLYESISTKLMAPFNSRVALNKYDGSKLTEQSVIYDRQLDEFRSSYKAYDEAISKALKINCVNEPVAFYDSVADARAKRQMVHQSTVALQTTIQNYKNQFEVFAGTLQEKKQ
ncbi:MAG TPA: hypothetical protein VFH06_01565 [Candidatus Saccharimonadales bacterium]|nr:hypothetical protein [Candidatus Saccharimonadales bacterium]